MRNPQRHSSSGFTLVAGLFIGLAVGQGALAAADEQPTTPPTPIPAPAAGPAPLSGQQVYQAVCIACHAPPGVGGAPALGNTEAWAGRIANGIDTLIDHALHGYSGSTGIMPMKGGRLDLADAEIIGAIEYMVAQVKQ